MKNLSLLVRASLIAVFLSCASAAQGVPPLSEFSRSLNSVGKPLQRVEFSSIKKVDVTYSLSDMYVRMAWFWAPPALPEGVLSPEMHPVVFRPTALQTVLGENALVVGGTGAGGLTVLERWDFGPPTTRKTLKYPSGNPEYTLIPGAISNKTALFSDPQGVEGPIAFLMTNHGGENEMFVGFHDTLNVYRMDTITGSMTLEVSGAQFPLLRSGIVGMQEVDHPTKGFIYFLYEDVLPVNGQTPKVFVLEDNDKNGSIEQVVVYLYGQAAALGYDDGAPLNRHSHWPPF